MLGGGDEEVLEGVLTPEEGGDADVVEGKASRMVNRYDLFVGHCNLKAGRILCV